MKTMWWKALIVVALVVVVGVVMATKNRPSAPTAPQAPSGTMPQPQEEAKEGETPPQSSAEVKLPRLLDLGAKKCIPCKMMAPLLEELARDYKGKLKVEFIDVWENPGAAEKYGIQSIPTQIFYDAEGKEFFRHVGFFPKEDILAKFKEKGITF